VKKCLERKCPEFYVNSYLAKLISEYCVTSLFFFPLQFLDICYFTYFYVLGGKATESKCFCKECVHHHTPAASTVGSDVIDEIQDNDTPKENVSPSKQNIIPPSVEETSLEGSIVDGVQLLYTRTENRIPPRVKEDRLEGSSVDGVRLLYTRTSPDGASFHHSLKTDCSNSCGNHHTPLSSPNCSHPQRAALSINYHPSEMEHARKSELAYMGS
jgi:hypothetical protein